MLLITLTMSAALLAYLPVLNMGSAIACSPREKNFSYPLALRATTVLICAVGGTLLASVLSAALGDATWSVSTGLGSCLIGGVYEVGRPDRLTVQEADHLEEQYQDFGDHYC